MNKNDAIQALIKKVYEYKEHLIISKKDIKKIEQYYISHSNRYSSVKDFSNSDKSIKEIIDKLKSGKDEINKQLKIGKALQPAILAECVFIQTLAKIIGLKNYIDLETTPFADVPRELAPYVKSKADTICAARYIYYNKKDYDTLIIQYGNPKAGDATAILYTNEIIIEIKDMPSLLMDTDLIYDEKGKLIIPEQLEKDYPEYTKYIDEFNKKTSVFEKFGSNYKLFETASDMERRELLKNFFNSSNIDIILTSIGKNDDLIAIKSEDIDFVFPDEIPLIYTSGSEIRTTGKNHLSSAFTPKYLETVLKEKDIEVNADGVCKVYNNNSKVIGKKAGRGKSKKEPSRFKISNAFFVRIKDITEYKDYIEFPKDKIAQSKSGISLHIEIKKNKEDIKKHLYK